MPNYSVADAKNTLPKLIDRALRGEEVVITRHGAPVVELKPAIRPASENNTAYAWLQARRQERPGVGMNSVEILTRLYEVDEE